MVCWTLEFGDFLNYRHPNSTTEYNVGSVVDLYFIQVFEPGQDTIVFRQLSIIEHDCALDSRIDTTVDTILAAWDDDTIVIGPTPEARCDSKVCYINKIDGVLTRINNSFGFNNVVKDKFMSYTAAHTFRQKRIFMPLYEIDEFIDEDDERWPFDLVGLRESGIVEDPLLIAIETYWNNTIQPLEGIMLKRTDDNEPYVI